MAPQFGGQRFFLPFMNIHEIVIHLQTSVTCPNKMEPMKKYLVGGAVRDQLLNLPTKDRDWVVVGATPEQLLQQGYQPVGKDFPVFLHPETHEEYALARTEKKVGAGYTGFDCYFGVDVSLEEDLSRRDLTINAMAMDEQGLLVDPYNGQQDLTKKQLRHVSDAFIEDPLRVLRVARFLARFGELGFQIAPETVSLMQSIAASGELQHLTPERVWLETEKALLEPQPWLYFQALRDGHCLQAIFPEVDLLFGVPQVAEHHPEIDTGIHLLLTLKAALPLIAAKNLSAADRITVLFSLVCHDLGKGLTPEHLLPKHHGHEELSEHLAKKLCKRLKTPSQVQRLAILVGGNHTHCHRALELKPSTVMRLFDRLDLFRRPETLTLFLTACEADARGRTGLEDRPYPAPDYLLDCAQAAQSVDPKELMALGFRGEALGHELRQRRVKAIHQIKKSYVQEP